MLSLLEYRFKIRFFNHVAVVRGAVTQLFRLQLTYSTTIICFVYGIYIAGSDNVKIPYATVAI